jgi:hypothetical protein
MRAGLVAALALAVAHGPLAQGLVSEFEPKGEVRWTLRSGEAPRIRSCELKPNGALSCRMDEALAQASCVAYHFGREQVVQARIGIGGTEFGCEGTRFPGKSLASQWLVRLQGEGGRQARWFVESRTPEQQRFAYELELQSSSLRSQEGGLRFGLGLFVAGAPASVDRSYPLNGVGAELGGSQWNAGLSYARGGGNSLFEGFGDWTPYEYGSRMVAPALRLRSGERPWDGGKAWAHTFAGGFYYRPSPIVRVEVLPFLSWYQVDTFRKGYGLEGSLGFRIAEHWHLVGSGYFGQVDGARDGRNWSEVVSQGTISIFWRSAQF